MLIKIPFIKERCMEHLTDERRRADKHPSFPVKDNEGHLVAHERRSGPERRKHKRSSDTVANILNTLN